MPSERLAIAQVTPFAWEASNEVNDYVSRVAAELARRGHRVMIVAPSHSNALVRDSRRALRSGEDSLLERADSSPLVLGVGEVLPFSPTRRRAASLPVDVARTIEQALTSLTLDVVHVHEPFAPSASSVALRHSRALNVGSFHAPTERLLSTQLTRPLSRLLFGRLDARTASYRATAELIQRYFPAEYRVILPGADADGSPRSGAPVELLLIAGEERAAMRAFLRALRAVPLEPEWHATVFTERPLAAPATLGRALRERVEFANAEKRTEAELISRADVVVLASEGVRPTPGILVRALAAGAVPVASRLPAYEELLSEGEYGFEFEPGDVQTLASHLSRLISEPELRERARDRAQALRATLSWSRVTDELEEVYGRLAARRHDSRGDSRLRARIADRRLIDVDLHMHTDHSYDCATPVEVLLAEARSRGLGAIAITDHNEISGAQEAVAKADGVKVIVAEEVKTADQGEVIGLFIEEKISRGMSLQETIAEIKRQGGLVYVPHPFDRLHSVPDYEHLLNVLDGVDAIEVFNPRVAIAEFNDEAMRFAAKYRIPAGAGSDAHVPQGLGSVRIKMHDFEGPEEFLESLRDADIVRNPASLLYVQALKFLQTRALPEAARRASRDRRVRRATAGPPNRAPRATQLLMHPQGQARGPSNPRVMPATDDEIREKYLERAIRELNAFSREAQACTQCARGQLMPVLGSGHPQADIFLIKYSARPSEVEEGVAFYGRTGNALMKSLKRLSIDPLAVYGTLCVKCPVADPSMADPACVARLAEELQIVSPKIVVVMGPEALEVVGELELPLRREVRPSPGEIQRLTPAIDALYVPNIDEALDEESAKREFWSAFRVLGDWWTDLPPY